MFYILNSASTPVPASITNSEITLGGTSNGYDDVAVYGQILDGVTPVVGALVRVTNDTTSTILGHTYSGCDGNYMLAVPAASLTAADNILIEVIGTDLTRTPTACAT
ncbi:hypothetical protein [Anaeroselena agilis]|uniref:Carboxypeptidase regulatory-like domain-containing protein n=1 Tax=Anaeroselena agilis TaxID=3063788 RepID=A0ABU3NX56_9FIRM|nr:hypothetical protein [Selenomonadales bacterium 4137-cl]